MSAGEAYTGKVLEKAEIKKEVCICRHIASHSEVTDDAMKQLLHCQRLKGMRLVVGQPGMLHIDLEVIGTRI